MASPATIVKLLGVAIKVASHSWEYSAVHNALLEWHNPDLSIWNNPFPNGAVPKLDVESVQALKYIKNVKGFRTDAETLIDAADSAGDAASLGIPAILIGKSDSKYTKAAQRQFDHLLDESKVVRWTPGGAISHREHEKELWSDFIYMAPPFIAYHGVATNNLGQLKEAARQCKLYGDVLKSQQGPWQHITGKDTKLWSTGNGWAVAGMAQVIATMKKSTFNSQTQSEQATLTGLIKEIIDGAIKFDNDGSGLLRNYFNTDKFGEVSGTALIAATAFRMAKLKPDTFGGKYTEWAEKKRKIINDSFTNPNDGYVGPSVDPYDWNSDKKHWGSPEGQAFVVMMHAAYRDWKK